MKKSSKIILAVVLVLAAIFYYNMYRNGTFNEVKIEEKDEVTHLLQGRWLEGSFSVSTEEKAFFDFQRVLIEELNCEKVSVYYVVNPTKENHNTFKAFMGIETDSTKPMLSKDFVLYQVKNENVWAGSQKCAPGYQRIHKVLQDKAEEESIRLVEDYIYEEFSESNFYVEMKIDK